MMAVDPLVVTASAITVARFILEQVERHQSGEITDAQLAEFWSDLQLSRDDTKEIWAQAKIAGGYI